MACCRGNISAHLLTCCAVQAANAAAAAEGNAMGSANHARIEQSMASLAAAMAAMALFEQVTCAPPAGHMAVYILVR